MVDRVRKLLQQYLNITIFLFKCCHIYWLPLILDQCRYYIKACVCMPSVRIRDLANCGTIAFFFPLSQDGMRYKICTVNCA